MSFTYYSIGRQSKLFGQFSADARAGLSFSEKPSPVLGISENVKYSTIFLKWQSCSDGDFKNFDSVTNRLK